MGRFRNPRYAPEFLERKLSPSAVMGGIAPPAMIAPSSPPGADTPILVGVDPASPPSDGGPCDPTPGDGNPDDEKAPDGNGDPPVEPPGYPPFGPVGPGFVSESFVSG